MFLVVVLSSILLFFLGKITLKGTVFDVSLKRNCFSGLLIYKELFLLVIPGVIFLNYFGADKFHATQNVVNSSVFPISIEIILSITIFFMTVLFFSKILFLKNILKKYKYNSDELNKNYKPFLYYLLCFGMFLVAIFHIKYGAKHAFLYSILSDDSLLSIRLQNTYETNIPSVLTSYLNFVYFFLVALLGSNVFDSSRFKKYIFVLFAIFLATFFGGKAPFFNVLLVFLLSYYSFHGLKINILNLFKMLILILLIIILLFYVVRLQYNNFNFIDFLFFLFDRIGVGQIAGVYEQFNLKLRDINYIWHAVPFANQFIDYPVFQKDLMLISENVLDPTRTGVKSSLFISEAYAMGGRGLAFISPCLVGFSFVFSYLLLFKLLNKTVCDKYTASKIMPLLFLSFMNLTGDFSAWFMFKGCLLLAIFLLITWLPFWFLRQVLKPLKHQLAMDRTDA